MTIDFCSRNGIDVYVIDNRSKITIKKTNRNGQASIIVWIVHILYMSIILAVLQGVSNIRQHVWRLTSDCFGNKLFTIYDNNISKDPGSSHNAYLTQSKSKILTARIWSPTFSRPSLAATLSG